jgi:hypothetical protein
MSSNFTGNPAGIVSPMVSAPAPNVVPVISIPSDGDAANAASISPAPQQLANHIAYLMQQAVWNATYPATSTNLPQMRFKDAAGNGRSVVDHNGFAGLGRVSRLDENWLSAPGAATSTWVATLGTAAAIAAQSPTASYNARYLQFTPSTTSGAANYSLATSVPMIMPNIAGLSLVLEFEIGLNAAAAGTSSNTSWWLGLSSGVDPYNDVSLITLYKKYNVANYQQMSGAGAISAVGALTVPTAPVAGNVPTDRIRFEIQGSGSPYGAYQARVWINEVLVSTYAAVALPAVAQRLTFGCANEGGVPSGSPLGFLGPIYMTWNRFTSGPAL